MHYISLSGQDHFLQAMWGFKALYKKYNRKDGYKDGIIRCLENNANGIHFFSVEQIGFHFDLRAN